MPAANTVAIDEERTLRFTARLLSTGLYKPASGTIVAQYVKQVATPEYWNGSAWVTADPGSQAMAEDAIVLGIYEDAVTLDEAGVDYICTAWDDADTDVAKLSMTVRGRLAEDADGVVAISITMKETDTNGDPIPDVIVSVRNASGNEISRDTTDSNGLAPGLRVTAAGTYTVVPALGSWTFNDESMVVSAAEVAAGTKAIEYYGTQFDAGSPAANYTRIYGWLREIELGTAIQDQRIRVQVLGQPYADASGVYYDHENSQDTPDSNGYWFVDVREAATVRIYSTRLRDGTETRAIDKTVLVPAANAALADLDPASIS